MFRLIAVSALLLAGATAALPAQPMSTARVAVSSPNGRSPSPLRRARYTTRAAGAKPKTIEATCEASRTLLKVPHL